MKKRLLSALLALCMVLTLLPGAAMAADLSGSCGESVTWLLKDGVLTISGTGPMKDYTTAPWHGWGKPTFHTLIVESGVTYIGYMAFDNSHALTEVILPDTITSIGGKAFQYCNSLKAIQLPPKITAIYDSTFYGCTSLESIYIPRSVTRIGEYAFPNVKDIYYEGSEEEYNKISGFGIDRKPKGATVHYNSSGFLDTPSVGSIAAPDISLDTVTLAGKTATTVVWNSVENATYYSITVYDVTRGSYVFRDQIMDSSVTTFLLDNVNIVDGNTYEIYVKAIDANGNKSEKSNVITWTPVTASSIDISSYLSEKPDTSKSLKGAYLVDTPVVVAEQNNFVTALVQSSIPEDTVDRATIVERLQKLLFQSTYRPQVFGGQDSQIKEWPIQNYAYSQGSRRTNVPDLALSSTPIQWENPADGCLSYGHFVSAYLYGTNGKSTSPLQYTKTGESIKNYFGQHADPGETIFYCYGQTYNAEKGKWVDSTHAIVFLGENESGDGFYFLSYGGGLSSKGTSRSDRICVGYFSYTDFASTVYSWYKVWDTNDESYNKNTSKINISGDCPIEFVVYADDSVLSSTGVNGTISNQFATLTASGAGEFRRINVTIEYSQDVDYRFEVIGTDNGYMDLTVTYIQEDGTEDIRTFKNVPVETSMVASTSYLSTQSSLELQVDYSDSDDIEIWIVNSGEVATAPDETYIAYNPDTESGDETVPSIFFTDVTESDWFYDEVVYVVQNGLMQGVGGDKFNPSGTTTRGMIVTILYRLEGEPAVPQSTFADVPAGQWYTDAVAWAAANRIVEGYGNSTFGPNDDISREQMATILYRYATYKGYDVSGLADLSSYTDTETINSWALTAVRWANHEGLITGRTTTTLVPTGDAIRAEAATILMRFCQDVAGLE